METVTVESDGFHVETNTGTAEQITENLTTPPVAEPAPADPDPQAPPEPVAAPKPKVAKPRDDTQARISQEVNRRKAVEREKDDLAARVRALEASQAPPQAPVQPAPVAAGEKFTFPAYAAWIDAHPDLATDPDNYDAWQDAKLEAHADWREAKRDAKTRETAVQQTFEQQRTEHVNRERAAVTAYPDYFDVRDAGDAALKAEGVALSPVLLQAIVASPHSADVVYWLGSHPDDLVQLARDASGLDVAAAPIVQKLLDALVGAGARPGAAPPLPSSNAKAPIKPVGTSLVTAPAADPDDEPFERYFHRANASDRKAGRL